jgi:ABC-type lipoprotein release transport system permease subunit
MTAGSLLALIGGRLVGSQLYGITRNDPWALVASVLLLLIVATAASAVPTMRAARADPLEALRAD